MYMWVCDVHMIDILYNYCMGVTMMFYLYIWYLTLVALIAAFNMFLLPFFFVNFQMN